MAAFLWLCKIAFLFISLAMVILGLGQIMVGTGAFVTLPEVKILEKIGIGAGPIPSGIILILAGAYLFVALLKWRIAQSRERIEVRPDGTKKIEVTRTVALERFRRPGEDRQV